jgi:hypothetical protein
MLDDDSEGLSARARFDWFEAVSDLYSGFFAGINDWLAERNMYYIVKCVGGKFAVAGVIM